MPREVFEHSSQSRKKIDCLKLIANASNDHHQNSGEPFRKEQKCVSVHKWNTFCAGLGRIISSSA